MKRSQHAFMQWIPVKMIFYRRGLARNQKLDELNIILCGEVSIVDSATKGLGKDLEPTICNPIRLFWFHLLGSIAHRPYLYNCVSSSEKSTRRRSTSDSAFGSASDRWLDIPSYAREASVMTAFFTSNTEGSEASSSAAARNSLQVPSPAATYGKLLSEVTHYWLVGILLHVPPLPTCQSPWRGAFAPPKGFPVSAP